MLFLKILCVVVIGICIVLITKILQHIVNTTLNNKEEQKQKADVSLIFSCFMICFLLAVNVISFNLLSNEQNKKIDLPEQKQAQEQEQEQEQEVDIWETYTFTAYCPCIKCCGKWSKEGDESITGAEGTELVAGYSCASPLPFGTIIETINGQRFKVQDRTSIKTAERYENKIVDVYFSTHSEAESFGKQVVKIKILN